MNNLKFPITLALLMCFVIVSCQSNVKAVWTGGSGRVPLSCPAPEGFTISPQEAQAIVEKRFGMSKTVRHIYADSLNYYIVSGFLGSDDNKAVESGVRVNGKTGECSGFK